MSDSNASSVNSIVVVGACEHNLKNVSITIPRNKTTVITGLSGSGKSSLAFDTIYAEAQRRYIESLSSYARQFLEQLKKPDVESISGLSPSIAIEQKTISHNPRSTVGTVTEIYDYLRLLYAKVGVPKCPIHHHPVSQQKPDDIVKDVFQQKSGSKFLVLSPVVRGKKGEFSKEITKWLKRGFVKARVDGQWVELADIKKLSKTKVHDIELLVDRLIVEDKFLARFKENLNLALSTSEGFVTIEWVAGEKKLYSLNSACPECGYSFPELEPRLFSFNNPRGACQSCNGIGYTNINEEEDDELEEEISEFSLEQCPKCEGFRLRPEALNVFLNERHIGELSNLNMTQAYEFFRDLKLPSKQKIVAEKILQQLTSRLEYINEVGCSYLSLSRPTGSLSGGEAQRIRLATQLGTSLVGVLYVLDEPSIGLHPRDHQRLLKIIDRIKDRGNTILMVEHDEDTMRGADYLVDLGPRAGRLGGQMVAHGTPQDVEKHCGSLTGEYLSGKKNIARPESRRLGNGKFLKVQGASGNNLKNVNVSIPLGVLCGVTGVSGSGKSTLIRETLYRYLSQKMNQSSQACAPFEKIEGIENIDRVIEINQKPIGRTPRSIPATYVGLLPLIRGLYSALPEAQVRGYGPGYFSFNVKGGRCENCQGLGKVKLEMHFLSDVYVTCERCEGRRFHHEILNIKYKQKTISDVLSMSVEEACEFFEHHKALKRKLDTLMQVGLDYITLGQNSVTLSGGEAQRVKLSKELSKRATGNTLYILDEPTTGLHFEDINKLIQLLNSLVDQGNTVLIIEHNLDVIKCCDYLIDMGPDGGVKGGEVVVVGTPEQVAEEPKSETGRFLKKLV